MLAAVNNSGYKAQLVQPPVQRVRFPDVISITYTLWLLAAAGRWNNPVHPNVFDHLPVVVEAMRGGKRCEEETRGWPAATRGNLFDEVRAVQGRHRFVAEC